MIDERRISHIAPRRNDFHHVGLELLDVFLNVNLEFGLLPDGGDSSCVLLKLSEGPNKILREVRAFAFALLFRIECETATRKMKMKMKMKMKIKIKIKMTNALLKDKTTEKGTDLSWVELIEDSIKHHLCEQKFIGGVDLAGNAAFDLNNSTLVDESQSL